MKTILVVDDRPTNREVLTTLLGYRGHRLLEADNGDEALAIARQEHPDLIISDILMPIMDGIEMARHLRSDPECCRIPIIFCTATFLHTEATALAQSLNVEHVFYKPIEPEKFLAAADALLAVAPPAAASQMHQAPRAHRMEHDHRRLFADKLISTTDALRTVNERLRALTTLILRLQNCDNTAEITNIVARFAPRLLPGIPGALFLFNNSRNILRATTTWNSPTMLEFDFKPDRCCSLRRGQTHTVTSADDNVCGHVNPQVERYMCRPLLAHGEVLGVLYLEAVLSPEDSENCEPGSRDLDLFAESICLALGNCSLQERLRNQSIRDSLTGLFNRRYFEEELELELARAIREESEMAVVMCDIDHFKQFNDTFGHDAGDFVLKEVAELMAISIRGGDVACRFGGEEFILLLHRTSSDGARSKAESITNAIRGLDLRFQGRALGAVTVSIGVAAFPGHAGRGAELITAADVALYAAKQAGRDRVEVASLPRKLSPPAASCESGAMNPACQ